MTTDTITVPRIVYESLAQIAEGKMSKHDMQDLAAAAYNILSRATPRQVSDVGNGLLSSRLRAGIECAPWVIDAVRKIEDALESLPHHAAKVPDGWKLVPVEPTDSMVWKGCECHECVQMDSYYADTELSEYDCIAIYKAMLAAAPECKEKV